MENNQAPAPAPAAAPTVAPAAAPSFVSSFLSKFQNAGNASTDVTPKPAQSSNAAGNTAQPAQVVPTSGDMLASFFANSSAPVQNAQAPAARFSNMQDAGQLMEQMNKFNISGLATDEALQGAFGAGVNTEAARKLMQNMFATAMAVSAKFATNETNAAFDSEFKNYDSKVKNSINASTFAQLVTNDAKYSAPGIAEFAQMQMQKIEAHDPAASAQQKKQTLDLVMGAMGNVFAPQQNSQAPDSSAAARNSYLQDLGLA